MENKEKEKKNYNFGEKKTESYQGKELPVWQSPKYLEAKKGVIEILESEQYKGVLNVSDFWILMNTCSNKTKMMYTGLIISHNGCLKINDLLENKFKPECVSLDKEGYNNSLVYTYQDEEVYEVGEVSKDNCKNDYPYAMALKRCFDRVVLKKCKLAYKGIYSDSEAEEFTEKLENNENIQKEEVKKLATPEQITKLKELVEDIPAMLYYFKVEKIEDLSYKQAEETIKRKSK